MPTLPGAMERVQQWVPQYYWVKPLAASAGNVQRIKLDPQLLGRATCMGFVHRRRNHQSAGVGVPRFLSHCSTAALTTWRSEAVSVVRPGAGARGAGSNDQTLGSGGTIDYHGYYWHDGWSGIVMTTYRADIHIGIA
jgi:hypothetical protein